MKRSSAALALLFQILPAVLARPVQLSCGTHSQRSREEIQLHRQSLRRHIKSERKNAAASAHADAGNIAIIDDSDGVVARRNAFNLNQRTLRFIPVNSASGYMYQLDAGSYDPVAAGAGNLLTGIGDDDTREVPLPFPFPFFARQYSSIFINSDGNASFLEGDKAIT